MKAWSRWVCFLEAREVGTSIALVRILVATCVLRTLGSVWWSGVYGAAWADDEHGGWRRHLDSDLLWRLVGGFDPGTRDVLAVACVISAALVAVGVGGQILARMLAFVCLQSFLALTDLNGHATGSYDSLMTNALWLLVLAGPSRTLSVECRVATGAWTSDRTVMRWPRFLIVVQAVIMYGTTGWQKLSDHWVPGGDLGALWYIEQQPTWQIRDMRWMAPLFPLTQVGTLVTWLWEVSAPVWLWAWLAELDPAHPGRIRAWLRRVHARDVYLVLGVVFHSLVAVTMQIGPFSWASLALYPAFVHPHEWRALAARWRR